MTVVGEAQIRFTAVGDVTGDLTKGATQAADQVGQAGVKGAGKFKSAMTAMGGSLSAAFGPAFAPIQEVMQKFTGVSDAASNMGSKTGASFLKIGGAATGAGVLLTSMGDKGKIATGQLQQAIQNAGGSWDDYEKRVESISKKEEKYGHTSAETAQAMNTIVTRTGNVKGAMDNMGLATDIAAAKHMSLNSAAGVVAKVMQGNTRVLKQYGISQDDLAKATHGSTDANVKAQAALDILSKRMHGQADVAADTFTGHMKEARARITDFVEEVGQKAGPVLTALGPTMMGVGAVIESGLIGKLGKAAQSIGKFADAQKIASAATKTWTVIQAIFNAVMDANPIILIAVGIAALIALIVIAYVKFKPFREIVQDVGKALKVAFIDTWHAIEVAFNAFIHFFENVWKTVVDIVKKYGLIILAAIMPTVGIPLLIITHWQQIIGFMSNLWNTIYGTVSHFVGSIIDTIAHFWSTVVNFFRRIVNDVTSTMAAMPGRVAAAIAGLVGAVVNIITQMWHSGVSAVQAFVSNAASAAGQLVGRIVSALSGLGSAVMGAIRSAFSGVQGAVTGAFSGAASWLYDIGASIIQGLINGIKSAIGGIGSAVSGIGGLIKKLKGPLPKDLTLLSEEGQAIITGLINGINSKIPHLTDTMTNVTKNIKLGPTGTAAGIGANASVAAGAGIGGVYNFFPYATVQMADESPQSLVTRMTWAVQASRM